MRHLKTGTVMLCKKKSPLSFVLHFPIPQFLFFLLLLSFSSCKKPGPDPEVPVTNLSGIYVLNEGLFNMNNSSLSHYDFKSGKTTGDIFLQVNARGLGDTGNDLKKYGSKLYCIVTGSGQLEVMNVKNCQSLKRISMMNEQNVSRQPRRITFHRNKAYICCFDGSVIRIDTASLAVDAIAQAGANPEGICVANNKLYVTNSGGLNNPNYDNTVSVFDLNTFTETKKITVGINPSVILPDEYGDLYLVSRGNYGSIPYKLQRIDGNTDELAQTFDLPVLNFTISGDYAYLYHYDYNTHNSWIKVLDVKTETIVKENFITDGTAIQTPYGINTDPETGDVYIADAYNFTVTGDVYCFDRNGKKKFRFETGYNPNSIIISK